MASRLGKILRLASLAQNDTGEVRSEYHGRDLTYNPQTRLIETNKEAISKDDKSSGIRSARPEVAHRLILNTYKTLLTRGQKGCYIYCEDSALREYIKQKTNISMDATSTQSQ